MLVVASNPFCFSKYILLNNLQFPASVKKTLDKYLFFPYHLGGFFGIENHNSLIH